jgi:AcrR family transcriptional regulator
MVDQATVAAGIAQKRDAILQHAIETFADEGFRNADVQVIADRAAVGKGTVYRYFGNKEELFFAASYAVSAELQQYMLDETKQAATPLEQLRAACVAFAEFFEAKPKHLEVFVQERAQFRGHVPEAHMENHEQWIAAYCRILQQGIDEGEIRPVDPRATIKALGMLINGSAYLSCYFQHEESLSALTSFAVDTFLEGLRVRSMTENCRPESSSQSPSK